MPRVRNPHAQIITIQDPTPLWPWLTVIYYIKGYIFAECNEEIYLEGKVASEQTAYEQYI
jgi:hypothetical protein